MAWHATPWSARNTCSCKRPAGLPTLQKRHHAHAMPPGGPGSMRTTQMVQPVTCVPATSVLQRMLQCMGLPASPCIRQPTQDNTDPPHDTSIQPRHPLPMRTGTGAWAACARPGRHGVRSQGQSAHAVHTGYRRAHRHRHSATHSAVGTGTGTGVHREQARTGTDTGATHSAVYTGTGTGMHRAQARAQAHSQCHAVDTGTGTDPGVHRVQARTGTGTVPHTVLPTQAQA